MLRLFLSNIAYRMGELGERLMYEPLCGDTFIDQIKAKWQGTSPKATR